MSKKLPAILFYPGDWRKDPGIQALDYESRGVWFEMLLLMYESDKRGYLTLNGMPMPEPALAQFLGIQVDKLIEILNRLESYGVAKRDEKTGALFNRRMVRDNELSEERAHAGRRGGKMKAKALAKAKQKRTKHGSKVVPNMVATLEDEDEDEDEDEIPSKGGGVT